MSAYLRHRTRASIRVDRDHAVERQLTECRSEFLRYFRRHLAQPEDAEDAVQDFSLKVLRAKHTLRDGEKVDAWLGRILRNTLTDRYRRRAARQRAEQDYALEPREPVSLPEPGSATPCNCVHAVLPTLKPDYALVICRADLDEAPRERVAAELGVTINNVGVRLHRARQALKARLAERCAGCCDGHLASCDCAERKPTRDA
jgi:RNA polymerase sigma-70 factor (ECF subfamily)